MKAREAMTSNPVCCTPENTAREAARMMRENNCGCLPVVENREGKRLIGTVTDRDLACRCLAEGKSADTLVSELMSRSPSCCGPEDELRTVEKIMEQRQVRRVPVIDEAGCCIGIIAQADLARLAERRAIKEGEIAEVVEKISEPTESPRRETATRPRPEAR